MVRKTLAEIKEGYREQGITYGKNPDKTPDKILREIIDRQVDPSVVEEAKYQCYMDNVGKILNMLGEHELAALVYGKLQKHITEEVE